MIESLIQALTEKIEQCGLEVLKRYPNDLLVHDRAMLERYAHRGAEIAWMAGHAHTHFVPLGLHTKTNEEVTCLTNLANDDRFFVLRIGVGTAGFALDEVGRDRFSALATTPVPYERKGVAREFWLYRNAARIGYCTIEPRGNYETRKYVVSLTPVSGITDLDKGALAHWAQRAVVETHGTLFARSELAWQAPMSLAVAA